MGKASEKRQKSGIRRRAPNETDLVILRGVIKEVAPKVEVQELQIAEQKLIREIDFFRQQYPYAGHYDDPTSGTNSRNSIAETREVLCRLNDAFQESLAAVMALQGNIEAMRQFCLRTGPAGKSTKVLQSLADAARAAFLEAGKIPNKTKDYAPALLAMGVVEVMRSVLGLKVAMTSDRNSTSYKGSAAAYAKLLRATLTAAGATPPNDLLGIMKQGKEMADLSDDETAGF